MAINIDSAQKLQEMFTLFTDLRRQDMFNTAAEAFAGASDVLRGGNASNLIKKFGGQLSPAEKEKARNDLLTTLSNYQAKRREDLRARDKDRLDFLKQQFGDVTGERRWAMEQEVALVRERMGNQTSITSARMGALLAEMRDSDRELEQGGFRAVANDNQRRAMIDDRTLVRVDEYVNLVQKARNAGTNPTASVLVRDFQQRVGALPEGQADHVMKYVANNAEGFADAIREVRDRPTGDLAQLNPGFAAQVRAANSDFETHRRQRREWTENREQVWSTFERQGAAGAPPELMRKLRAIYDEGPEETSRRVEEMLETLPDEIRNPAEERPLEEDAFTRQIQEQLDRLDDPRYMFAGSRHEQLKMEIMRSPEFQQYMAEKGDGGMIDPNQAFRMMLQETKAGLLTGNRDAQTVAAADAKALGGPYSEELRAAGGPAGRFGQYTSKAVRANTTPLDPTRPLVETAPEMGSQAVEGFRQRSQALSNRLSMTPNKRNMLRSLAEDTMTNADGLRDSTIKASQSARETSRLMQRLSAQRENE